MAPRHLVAGKTFAEASRLLDEGVVEYLCSVIQMSVGRIFTLDINVAEMLEHATPETVPSLQCLFEEILLNPDYTKMWWNPQKDIEVMDNTIAHFFQGTARPPYTHSTYYGDRTCHIKPRFHIKSPFFNGTRPRHLCFPTLPREDQNCDLHVPGNNDKGMSCPCSLGCIDIAAFMGHLCRLQGLPVEKLPWTQCRHGIGYEKFLSDMLKHDRIGPLVHKLRGTKSLEHYQRLGRRGLEQDTEVQGYSTIDVVGIAAVIDNIITSDDAQFVAGLLAEYCYMQKSHTPGFSVPRKIAQRQSLLGPCGIISTFEDNPRLYVRKAFKESTISQLPSMLTSDWSVCLSQQA
ncbi:hypothetical protein CLAFUW4_09871 [Fulvia fulva]|uniref:Uncharacterized protein n=1 Tax=Passalora fulva TaxID=5499 RepID=A0A9Q8PIG6_PASFU|nr:uncharacterized protein CLAFUR5_12368 [Fulvia fulva]KAK4615740.1 hypothetical protein CLAFUR4_09877 [Fulvia fulva]KAK4616876.1 hypothetical protein CLAFUR0_09870 [Fulvia fulva]UJO23032.1 hypothetical protein CLAFUR5_12368 [Fulvia fulva]WPV18724.1 hypothetical protein CLAFUW4_09871 [Fulvia fulva]WPV33745.1 hypothetical protein CLAFUW7_09874 [Fulvia fulva]